MLRGSRSSVAAAVSESMEEDRRTIVHVDRHALVVKVHEDGVEQPTRDIQPRVHVVRERSVATVARDLGVGHLAVDAHVLGEGRHRDLLQGRQHAKKEDEDIPCGTG